MNYSLTFTSVTLHQLLVNSTSVSSEHTTCAVVHTRYWQWGRNLALRPSPVYRCTLIKVASKPPVPSATWVSHHLERARDDPPLSWSLTAIPANEGTLSLFKDLRASSWPWAGFDKVLHVGGGDMVLGVSRECYLCLTLSYFQKDNKGNKGLN